MIPAAVVVSVLLASFVLLAVHHGPCTGCPCSDQWKLGCWKEQLAGCCWQEPCGKDVARLGSHSSGKESEPAVRGSSHQAVGKQVWTGHEEPCPHWKNSGREIGLAERLTSSHKQR